MTIAKDFASKFAVAFVAAAMIFSAIAPAVQAAESNEDLQKMINDLLAQVAALQAQTGGTTTTTTTTTTTCDVPMAPLTIGSQGGGVTALQNILISGGYAIPAGATGYFGAQTKAALASWQAANGVAPAVGYYGPISMAALQANCADDEDEDMDEDEDEDEDMDNDDLSGEGSLDVFEIDNASDTDVQEGAEDVEIAELTMEATDGDIEVSRVDIQLVGVNTPTETDPWEVFETITLWVDGDMIAEMTADDEDEYLDEDAGTLRFSDVDLVLMEDEEVEVLIGATIQGDVDGAGTDADWTVSVEEVRTFDADGVASDEDSIDEIGQTAAFTIEEEGDGEELKFSLGDNNPESTDIVVDEDDTTDGVTILEYTIEAEEGDIEINNLVVRVDTVASTTNVVDDIMLVIDGEEFDSESLVSTNKGTISATESRFVNNNVSGTAVWYAFDIDGDVVVDMDEEVTVEVVVDFKAQDPNGVTAGNNYNNGSTITAEVTSVERDVTDAEGADDLSAANSSFSGSAAGEDHTLVAEGIIVPVDGFTSEVDTLGTNDTIGEFVLEFEVTAVEGDFYIKDFASTTATTGTGGIEFAIDPVAAGTVTATFESTADEDTATVFTVQEGETETFTLTVTYDPAAAGAFRVQLEEIFYSSNVNGVTGSILYTPLPAQDFRTASQAINQ